MPGNPCTDWINFSDVADYVFENNLDPLMSAAGFTFTITASGLVRRRATL
jgi:hypothetical protein